MSAREKKSDLDSDDVQETVNKPETGGRESGGTPDYERNQTPNNDQKDFDNSKSSW